MRKIDFRKECRTGIDVRPAVFANAMEPIRNYILALMLLLCVSPLSLSQTPQYLSTFFKKNVGLNEAEVARIEQGQSVAKVLDSPKPSQIFIFGATSIRGAPDAFVRFRNNFDRIKSLPGYLSLQLFSKPPVLSDLTGLTIDPKDVDELKECKPTDCDVQLPAAHIEQFRRRIDWSGPDPGGQVNHLAKEMTLQALLAYQQGGNAALGIYEDKEAPAYVSKQFRSLLERGKFFPEKLPALYSNLLYYPEKPIPGSTSVFYWEKIDFGLRPTIRVNQQITAHMNSDHGPVDVVAIKQLYANHYFQTALELYFCIPRSSTSFYLVTVKGSEQDGLTGTKGRMIRKVATSRTRASLEDSLLAIKKELEH